MLIRTRIQRVARPAAAVASPLPLPLNPTRPITSLTPHAIPNSTSRIHTHSQQIFNHTLQKGDNRLGTKFPTRLDEQFRVAFSTTATSQPPSAAVSASSTPDSASSTTIHTATATTTATPPVEPSSSSTPASPPTPSRLERLRKWAEENKHKWINGQQ